MFETSVNASLRSVNDVFEDIMDYFINVKKLGARKLSDIGIKHGSIENRWKMIKAFMLDCLENFSLVTEDNFSVIVRESSARKEFNELTLHIIKTFDLSETDIEISFLRAARGEISGSIESQTNFHIADIFLKMLTKRQQLDMINNNMPSFMWKDYEKEKIIKYFFAKGLVSFDPMPPKYSGKVIKFLQNELFAFSTPTMEEFLKSVTVFDPTVLNRLPNVGSLSFGDKIKILSENQPFIKMCITNPKAIETDKDRGINTLDNHFTGTLKNLWRGRHLARKINI